MNYYPLSDSEVGIVIVLGQQSGNDDLVFHLTFRCVLPSGMEAGGVTLGEMI